MSWLGYWGNDEEENKVRKFRWSPKPDITTYELALCMKMLIATNAEIAAGVYDSLPENAKRHIREVE